MIKSAIRLFDNQAVRHDSSSQIDWIRVLPFIMIHIGALTAFWVKPSAFIIVFCILFYCARIFFIGAFYHRYFSHKSYKTSRVAQCIFALLGMTSAQRGPLWWAAHHRQHHAHTDTEKDPHSPHIIGFLKSHMGWFLQSKNFHYDKEAIGDFYQFKELRILDRFDSAYNLLLVILLCGLGWLLQKFAPSLGTSPLQMLVWGYCLSTVLVYHATFSINSLCHIFGTKPSQTKDQSRNNFILAFLTFGEGWHNNHHRYPPSARQGFKWWQYDITYYGLLLLEKCRIIYDIKHPPKKLLS